MLLARLGFARAQAGTQHGTGGLLQRTQRQCTDAVLAVDHLALFGHAQAPADAPPRRCVHRMGGLGTATADRPAAAVEEGQVHAELIGHFQQFHLRLLQPPARCGDATILAAVRIAQHHHLHVVTRGQVGAIDRVGQQVAQRGGAAPQVVHGLEQGCDIQRHRIAVIQQTAASRQCQHGKYVATIMRHRDDVAAQGIGTVATARIGHRAEYLVQPLARFIGSACQRCLARGIRRKRLRACCIVQRVECFLPAQHFGEGARMHARFLAHIQPCQMEAEGTHAPQQATHREPTGVLALVCFQAVEDQLDVADEFFRRRICSRRIGQGGLQTCAHAVIEQPVRHVGVTRPRLDFRQQLAILRHPRYDRIADAHQLGGLAEQAGQPEHVLDVQLQHRRTLRVQRGGDGAGIHVGIAVHVAAHPRTETQQTRQTRQRQRAPPGVEQRLFQRFVEHRDHPVQHAGEIETHMLAFVIDGGTYGRGIGGLPRRGQRHAETRGIGSLLAWRALAVEVVDQ
ncbi:hypothetical protein D3C81_881010 [compost metagenome]